MSKETFAVPTAEPEQKVIERLLAQPTVWEFDAATEAREQLRRLYTYWYRRETTGSAPVSGNNPAEAKPPAQGISPKGIESESKVGKI